MANDDSDSSNPLKYGVLNPVDDPIPERYNAGSDSDGAVGNINRVIDTVRQGLYSGKISVDGEYNGVVLAKEPASTENPDKSNNWDFMTSFLSENGMGSVKGSSKYYVRVPEIDAMTPMPESEEDSERIALHNAFFDLAGAGNSDKDAIGIGNIVRVSFYNSEGSWMPHIKEKVGNIKSVYPEKQNSKEKSKADAKSADGIGGYNEKGVSEGGSRGIKDKKVSGKTNVELIPPSQYKKYSENRVRVVVYGTLPMGSSLAINVTSAGAQRKMHKLAAKRFEQLRQDALQEGFDFRVTSGLRRHRWNSREHYEQQMIEEYGSVEKGDNYVAYQSPHETGLAMDLASYNKESGRLGTRDGGPGAKGRIRPESDTITSQRQTAEFKWLQQNAYKYGFSPYIQEPWHWEALIPLKNWKNGEEFAVDKKDHRVHEYLIDKPSVDTTQERIIEYL